MNYKNKILILKD